MRGRDGEMCDQRAMKGRAQLRFTTVELRDLTIETWIRRNVLSLNTSETIVSSSNEANMTDGDFFWSLDKTGGINFHIVGHERSVGPCPVGKIDDVEWHHIAVVRSSDPSVVNNWMFYKDGHLVWSTRHEGVPIFHPFTNILIGKRHGEFWGGERRWRPGVGDQTCLQGSLCHLAVYNHAVRAERLYLHYMFEGKDSKSEITDKDVKKTKSVAELNRGKREEQEGRDVLLPPRPPAGGLTLTAQRRERFTTKLWSRTNVMTSADVSSFYESLQQNNIWKLTRRMFSPTISGENFNRDDAVGKSTLNVHPPASFATSLARNLLEETAQSMLETGIKIADPVRRVNDRHVSGS